MAERITVPRPPKGRAARAEFPAIVEPRLRDIPEPPDPQIEDWRLVESEPLDVVLTEEVVSRCREVALGHERVAGLLEGKRHVVIGVTAFVDDKESQGDRLLFLAYNYDDNLTVEVELIREVGEFTVAAVTETDVQPLPTVEEIELAIRLASEDPRVRDRIAKGYETTAILASAVDEGDMHYGSRRLNVGFGSPEERMPRVRALVDLTRQRVIGVALDDDLGREGVDQDE